MLNRLNSTYKQIQALHRQLLYTFERCTGMSATRLQLLYHLAQSDEISQTALQKLVGIDQAAITRHLKQLEAKDMVSRRTSLQDNRFTLVKLTENGHQQLEILSQGRDQFLKQMLRGFSEQELVQLSALLERINVNLGELSGLSSLEAENNSKTKKEE